jgi:hypothetical protein
MKQSRFGSGNTGVSVANVFVELLHAKNADEASARQAHAARRRKNGETAFAISPDNSIEA